MLITFLASSRVTPNLATRYCAGSVDAEGRTRDEVRVLRGSPQQFEQIAMGLSFREKYKSAVLAFAPGDDPSDEDLDTLLDEFEQVCFAGLDPTRFCLVAYLHKGAGKTDVHVLIANVDLLTGKHFNAAPPGWQRDFDPLRDAWNWRKGWARPDDPRRARAVQPGPRTPADAARIRAGLAVAPDVKKVLANMVMARVEAGLVQNRTDVVAALQEFGEVTRKESAEFVSVKLPGHKKAVRLRGTLFTQDFDTAVFLAPRPSLGGGGRGAKTELDIDPKMERDARAKLAAAIAKRSVHNERKYKPTKTRTSKNAMSAPSSDLLEQMQVVPPSMPGPNPATTKTTPQPKITHPTHQKAPYHDRTPHVFYQLLDELVQGVRSRFESFAGAIRRAGERLVDTGRAKGALAAVDRATLAGVGEPGGRGGRIGVDGRPGVHQVKKDGSYKDWP